MQKPIPKSNRRLNIRGVETRYGKHRQTIWRWTTSGKLPKPDYLNGQRSWKEDVLDEHDKTFIQSYDDRFTLKSEG